MLTVEFVTIPSDEIPEIPNQACYSENGTKNKKNSTSSYFQLVVLCLVFKEEENVLSIIIFLFPSIVIILSIYELKTSSLNLLIEI